MGGSLDRSRVSRKPPRRRQHNGSRRVIGSWSNLLERSHRAFQKRHHRDFKQPVAYPWLSTGTREMRNNFLRKNKNIVDSRGTSYINPEAPSICREKHAYQDICQAFALAVATPSCDIFDARDYRRYTCRNFRSPGDFRTHVRREPSVKPTWFQLIDSQLPSLPPAAFAGLNVSILELRSVDVRRFDLTATPTDNPFGGLEDTLLRLTFSLGTLPSSLALLSGLRQLEELELVHYGRLRLTRDFNHLPKSLKTLYIADATIDSIESGWISDLVNLESLIFRGTDLARFSRDLLPMPAPRFTTLDLP
ncbi:hypothetical protein V5799_029694 [Amblyomma americanum]|uniref:Uncharacterized protein n=1 Tax=Amblyomma americanum TaxID=6943 RepID=A0AAQ4EQC0_AMBAM